MATQKRSRVCSGEDEDKEDQKMEQFYDLIRNFHEARNRRKNELRQREEIKKKQNKTRRLDDEQSSWVPTFELADFTEEIEFRRPPIIFPSPYNKKEDKKKQEEDDGLDLKLTL
ncbi:protein NIM1-INTERACTING 1-like [Durio zibethinus]|uniref:Protein NIM1-INTERACTING 1-like n=1 Tax=Durio zibethinus TaxID=66656 RepID=A0A6P6AXX6_DURZI|nr:protein NIM1-INTERACTING 1-like [Durio zibethinus]